MKRFFASFTFLVLASMGLFAQNNLVVFSENGGAFYLFLNNIQQNTVPQTNIKVINLPPTAYQARIVFQDNSLANITRNLFFPDDEVLEATYVIRPRRNGSLDLRPFAQNPVNNQGAPGQFVVQFGVTPPPAAPVQPVQPTQPQHIVHEHHHNPGPQLPPNTHVRTQVHGTPQDNVDVDIRVDGGGIRMTVQEGPNQDQIDFQMRVGVPGGIQPDVFNMDVRVQGDPNNNPNWSDQDDWNNQPQQNPNQWNNNPNQNNHNWNNQPNNQPQNNNWNNQPQNNNWNNNPPCFAMSQVDYQRALKRIQDQSFDSERLTSAKRLLERNCLSTQQIRQIAQTITFESSRLDFVKSAYPACSDPDNFLDLTDLFTFSASKTELDKLVNP